MEQTELVGISRRRLLAMTSISAGVALLAGLGRFTSSGNAKVAKPLTTSSGTNTSFGPIKQIYSGLLNVGYTESGPANGPPVILLHGWPYDIYSFVGVAPLLAARGYRVIVPYLRGYGTTRFLSSETFRNGQPAAIASDIVAMMDALKIEKAVLAGFDWGARTANIIAFSSIYFAWTRKARVLPNQTTEMHGGLRGDSVFESFLSLHPNLTARP